VPGRPRLTEPAGAARAAPARWLVPWGRRKPPPQKCPFRRDACAHDRWLSRIAARQRNRRPLSRPPRLRAPAGAICSPRSSPAAPAHQSRRRRAPSARPGRMGPKSLHRGPAVPAPSRRPAGNVWVWHPPARGRQGGTGPGGHAGAGRERTALAPHDPPSPGRDTAPEGQPESSRRVPSSLPPARLPAARLRGALRGFFPPRSFARGSPLARPGGTAALRLAELASRRATVARGTQMGISTCAGRGTKVPRVRD